MIEAIESKELKGINKATEQIHVAVQYISMAGEFLTEHAKDGSHANMGWLSMKEKFISHLWSILWSIGFSFSDSNTDNQRKPCVIIY